MDIDKPVENPELVRAIDNMIAAQTPENEAVMIAALKAAYFLAPVAIDPPPPPGDGGATTFPEGTTINFDLLFDEEKRCFIPAFTDWGELRKWRNAAGQQTLVMRLEDYGQMLEREEYAGVAINPYGQNLVLNRERISFLTGKAMPYTVEEETEVLVGDPADPPRALLDALSAHMRTQPAIRAAWLRLMLKNGERSFLLVVDHDGDRRAVFDGIGRAGTAHLQPGEVIDLVPAGDEFGQSATRDATPFYRRREGLLGKLGGIFN